MSEQLHDSSEQRGRYDYVPLPIRVEEARLRALVEIATAGVKIQQENEHLRRDDVAPSFYNRRGAMRLLDSDRGLSDEFQEGRCGIVFLDVRFLKYINDTFSDVYGDAFLSLAAQKIEMLLDKHIRTKDIDHMTRQHDVRIRYGGDEFMIIVRNVTLGQLIEVAERLREEFSIDKACRESEEQGGIPIAANTVTLHTSELSADERQRKTGEQILTSLKMRLHGPHIEAKEAQYEEMWRKVKKATDMSDHEKPSDVRMIAGMFLKYCCPSFIRHVDDHLQL